MMAESTLFVFRSVLRICSYFNPRTPVGCDLLEISIRGNLVVISIHAPQWGATTCIFMLRHIFYISIHAPQWGATAADEEAARKAEISIHAPQWGATKPTGDGWLTCIFQSTHPSGVRHYRQTAADLNALFQSTHPSGVRPPSCWPCRPSAAYFNPRTPVGCCFCSIGS